MVQIWIFIAPKLIYMEKMRFSSLILDEWALVLSAHQFWWMDGWWFSGGQEKGGRQPEKRTWLGLRAFLCAILISVNFVTVAQQCSAVNGMMAKRREGRWTWSVGAAKVHINKLFPSRVVDLFPWHEASKQMNLWRKFRINDRNTAQNWYFFYRREEWCV